jgi:cytochrome oxidase Cu insertion factor (SCO1/SenC/PrrC family)
VKPDNNQSSRKGTSCISAAAKIIFTKEYSLFFSPTRLVKNDFIHTDKLVLIDKQQKIRGYYQGTSDKDIQTLIHDIQKLQDEK